MILHYVNNYEAIHQKCKLTGGPSLRVCFGFKDYFVPEALKGDAGGKRKEFIDY